MEFLQEGNQTLNGKFGLHGLNVGDIFVSHDRKENKTKGIWEKFEWKRTKGIKEVFIRRKHNSNRGKKRQLCTVHPLNRKETKR